VSSCLRCFLCLHDFPFSGGLFLKQVSPLRPSEKGIPQNCRIHFVSLFFSLCFHPPLFDPYVFGIFLTILQRLPPPTPCQLFEPRSLSQFNAEPETKISRALISPLWDFALGRPPSPKPVGFISIPHPPSPTSKSPYLSFFQTTFFFISLVFSFILSTPPCFT